jgi:hypothetical protein
MNALNRLIMLALALLLVVVPVLLLLVAFGVFPTGVVDGYTRYQSGLRALGGLSVSDLGGGAQTVAGIAGVVVALVALLLLLRELKFWRKGVSNIVIDGTPGKEIRLEARAARALVEGAAREAGATSPKATLSPAKSAYNVSCAVGAPASSDFTGLAARSRENISKVLYSQNVSVKNVEVTVIETAT